MSSYLIEAAGRGDVEGLKSVLIRPCGEADVQELNRGLLLAVTNGHSECVKILIDAKADPNTEDRNDYGNTALALAAINNHADVAKQLIEAGASVNKTNFYDDTALHYAVTGEHFDVVKLLLDAGIETDIMPPDGDLPLSLAASQDNYALTELLLQYGAQNNPKDFNIQVALDNACRNGNVKMVQLLLDYGAQINSTVLTSAFAENHTHLARFLVDHSGDLDMVRNSMGTALCEATCLGNKSAMASLLEAGTNPNFIDFEGLTPVINAVIECYVDSVKLLIQYGCNVDIQGETYLERKTYLTTDLLTVSPIYAAVWNKHVELSCIIYLASVKTQKQIKSILACNELKKEIEDHQGINTWLEDTFSNPPSLLHLCRQTVRASLLPKVWHVSSLSQTVSKLPIPPLLKEYLLMQM